jgi:hypothetical protein
VPKVSRTGRSPVDAKEEEDASPAHYIKISKNSTGQTGSTDKYRTCPVSFVFFKILKSAIELLDALGLSW